jgi:hypothetical protein
MLLPSTDAHQRMMSPTATAFSQPEVPANVSVFGRRLQMQEDVFQVSLQSGLAKASNTSLPPPEDLQPV